MQQHSLLRGLPIHGNLVNLGLDSVLQTIILKRINSSKLDFPYPMLYGRVRGQGLEMPIWFASDTWKSGDYSSYGSGLRALSLSANIHTTIERHSIVVLHKEYDVPIGLQTCRNSESPEGKTQTLLLFMEDEDWTCAASTESSSTSLRNMSRSATCLKPSY